MKVYLHQLYSHWIADNFNHRDFRAAVEHSASMCFINHECWGRPQYVLTALPPEHCLGLAVQPLVASLLAPKRFYTDEGHISRGVNLELFDSVLSPLFTDWVSGGWLARDFILAATECAGCINYSHLCAHEMAGLGGGKTGLEFLTTPYQS